MFSLITSIKCSVLLNQRELRAFLWIFGISLLCLLSLFQANILYLDDLVRTMYGKTFWEQNARPLASWISLILQLGKPLTDISPLPQIICLALYSFSFVLVAKYYQIKSLTLLVLSGIIFVINPYNLGIYSFIYDSFTMGFGLLTAILAFIFITIAIEKINHLSAKSILFILAIINLVFSLCLYQPVTAYYVVVFLFYLLIKLAEEINLQKSLLYLRTYFFAIVCSFIAYIPIKKIYVQESKYATRHSQIPSLDLLFPTVRENIKESWTIINYQLANTSIFLFLKVIAWTTIITIIDLFFQQNIDLFLKKKTNGQNIYKIISTSILTLLLNLFYFSLFFTLTIFPSFLLKEPSWTTRIFMGFSGLIGFSCLFLAKYWLSNKPFYAKSILIFLFSLLVMSFANLTFTYGNVIGHQNIYEERIGSFIISDIEENRQKLNLSLGDIPKISFVNSEQVSDLKRSNLNVKAFEKYPILYSITFPNLTGNPFGMEKFKTMGFSFEQVSAQQLYQENKDYYVPETQPIINKQLYRIYLEDDIFIVVFNP